MTYKEIFISVWFISLMFFTITTGLAMYKTEGGLATTIFTSMMSVTVSPQFDLWMIKNKLT